MKIAQIVSTPPMAWATGGCARVVYDLSRELADRGHEVTILTTDLYKPGRRFTSDMEISNPENIAILRFSYFSDWLAWKKKFFLSFGLLNHIRSHLEYYDIVHLQDLISIHAIFTAIYSKKKKIPYILSTHGSIPWLKRSGCIQLLFTNFFGVTILNNASIITVLNSYEKQVCLSYGVAKEKIVVLPNFLDCRSYTCLPEHNVFKQKYGIKKNVKILLYVGRIEKTKGLDLLIKVFADISKEQNDLNLVIIGHDDGYLKEFEILLRNLNIADKVSIIGYIDETDKIEAFVDASIMIYPRKWEPFGLSILEACACGTPVICSTRCGIAEFINQRAGLSFNYNFESLKTVITKLLSDSDLHEKLSKGGKTLIQEEFNPNNIVNMVEDIYNKTLKK